MFKRTKLISMVAIAALLGSGIATATAAPDHPKKKTTTQASNQAAKSTSKQAKPSVARPSAARPGAVRFEPREEVE
jgi:ribulose kinase